MDEGGDDIMTHDQILAHPAKEDMGTDGGDKSNMNREQVTVYLTLLGWEPFSDRLQGIVGIRHPDGSNSVVINTHNIMTTLEDVRASPRILHTAWCCLYDDELKRICDVLD